MSRGEVFGAWGGTQEEDVFGKGLVPPSSAVDPRYYQRSFRHCVCVCFF